MRYPSGSWGGEPDRATPYRSIEARSRVKFPVREPMDGSEQNRHCDSQSPESKRPRTNVFWGWSKAGEVQPRR